MILYLTTLDHYQGAQRAINAFMTIHLQERGACPEYKLVPDYDSKNDCDLVAMENPEYIVCFGKPALQDLMHTKLPPHKKCRCMQLDYNGTPVFTTFQGNVMDQSKFASQMVNDLLWVHSIVKDGYRGMEIEEGEAILGNRIQSFDIETTCLEYWNPDGKILCAGMGGESWVSQSLPKIKYALRDPKKWIMGHNLKFDYNWWTEKVGEIKAKLFDTEVAHALLNDNVYDNALGFLTSRMGIRYHKDMVDKGNLENEDIELVKEYNRVDVAGTQVAGLELMKGIKEAGMTDIMGFMMDLLPVFSRMERRGVAIDMTYHAELLTKYKAMLVELESKFPEGMNPNSSKQVSDWMYDDLGLPRLVRTPTGFTPVDKAMLEKLQTVREYKQHVDMDPAGAMLDYRAAKKLLSTYLEPVRERCQHDGRIHASWNLSIGEMGGTKTGRTSCRNPNLQQIPRGSEIRGMFVATNGMDWTDADYTGLEVAIQADLSHDEVLLGILERGENYHTATMSDFWDTPYEEIQGALDDHDDSNHDFWYGRRALIKRRNFGIQYGIGAKKLAAMCGIKVFEAKEMIDGWYRMFPGVLAWQDQIVQQGREDGFVTSPTGRRRTLPDLVRNDWYGWRAQRQACNMPVQSLASDVTMTAMYLIDQEMQKQGVGHLLLNVHDQIAFEEKTPKMSGVYGIIYNRINEIMTVGVVDEIERRFGHKISVPLVIDVNHGERWS
jgi:DNA polymerase-1